MAYTQDLKSCDRIGRERSTRSRGTVNFGNLQCEHLS